MRDDIIRDPGPWLPLVFRVNRHSVRHVYATNEVDGRIPRAHIVYGNLPGGNRWRFLQPWCQLAVGAHGDPMRFNMRKVVKQEQAPFVIIRLWSRMEQRPHFLPQCEYAVTCRFFRALVWVKGRGWSWTWVD